MFVVAVLGLLVAMAIPGFMQARKQSQGKRIVNDARVIDAAINGWAWEVSAVEGSPVDLTAAASYTKSSTINTVDVLGNPYVIGTVGDSQVAISAASKTALAGVFIDWGAY